MKLFRSEEEILQENLEKEKQEKELKKSYTNIKINITDSKEDIELLEQIRVSSKKWSKYFDNATDPIKNYEIHKAICSSVYLNFHILNKLSISEKNIGTLVEQNKELNNKFDMLIDQNKELENKFNTLIEQNKELNDKFDTLIETLKSK